MQDLDFSTPEKYRESMERVYGAAGPMNMDDVFGDDSSDDRATPQVRTAEELARAAAAEDRQRQRLARIASEDMWENA